MEKKELERQTSKDTEIQSKNRDEERYRGRVLPFAVI